MPSSNVHGDLSRHYLWGMPIIGEMKISMSFIQGAVTLFRFEFPLDDPSHFGVHVQEGYDQFRKLYTAVSLFDDDIRVTFDRVHHA
jgi:hypothetical protein